ncbi:MAG: hypothetical protein AAGJ18_30255, partial [Bacteroidota bacterium]
MNCYKKGIEVQRSVGTKASSLCTFKPFYPYTFQAKSNHATETLGLSAHEIAKGVAQVTTVGSRSKVTQVSDRLTIIEDCYNANPV